MDEWKGLEKIISGCHTDADLEILAVAQQKGLLTGGYCAKEGMTLQGPRPEIIEKFSLTAVGRVS